MKLTLETNDPYDTIHKLFATELVRKHDRSSITLQNQGGKAIFTITAQDVTALRAAVNTITSALSIYHKTKEAVQ